MHSWRNHQLAYIYLEFLAFADLKFSPGIPSFAYILQLMHWNTSFYDAIFASRGGKAKIYIYYT
jgi:hypothetical protein